MLIRKKLWCLYRLPFLSIFSKQELLHQKEEKEEDEEEKEESFLHQEEDEGEKLKGLRHDQKEICFLAEAQK